MPHPHDDFAVYAQAGWPRLVTTAQLLAGDPREATELVRNALVGVCARWRRIPRDDVDFYVRRSLVKEHLRRARRHQALPQEELGALSARQRVVLVMLHWEGLGETEIAQMLGCSAGAVRSRARRGLALCGGDAERLRGLFAEAAEAAKGAETAETADGVVPFAVPLGAIEHRGRTLRRRRVGAVTAVCALLLAPAAVFAADRILGAGGADEPGAKTVGMASSPIRIVAPGERVEAVPGMQVWLTTDGKHWSTPQRPNQFRGLAEDGGESEKPGVSAQLEPVNSAYFLSGLYHGLSADPARVEVTVDDSKITGSVLTLAGSPGWGVWYARAPLSAAKLKTSYAEGGPTITVYDAAGKVVARSGGDG
ncbi:sigma factor-like helix-turn-helix DNA-binding protein [Streptomyces sp. GESEQ-35]|uniref:sigma factor-like helix-turn-helix DNA-binding protein n=1 Tax=Streptomyces sp. GESEQ-35 TaxID=2812657 RepID=UPI001B32C075|nr:sigma factor-like helix-turn-helix DNA-binding protein [Streptomyces sp. GESEQ-35]